MVIELRGLKANISDPTVFKDNQANSFTFRDSKALREKPQLSGKTSTYEAIINIVISVTINFNAYYHQHFLFLFFLFLLGLPFTMNLNNRII